MSGMVSEANTVKHAMSGRWAVILRIVLGAVFVFSGVAKSFDPWGAAIKVEEYLTAFGMDALVGASGFIAVGQSVLETVLGLMLVCGIWKAAASFLVMLFMAFFTLLTLVIAVWNPLDDCGCFGPALKISNWATFAKNLVLLPVSVVVWRAARNVGRMSRWRDAAFTVSFAVVAVALNVWCWHKLPPVESFPFAVGADLRRDVMCSSCASRAVTLVYEDIQTGRLERFDLSDTTWYDTTRWRYVDTESPYDALPEKVAEYDFAIMTPQGDMGEKIAFSQGTTYIIAANRPLRASSKCNDGINGLLDALGTTGREHVVYVTAGDAADDGIVQVGGYSLRHGVMDGKTLQAMMRADMGVVVVTDGIIVDKRSCTDLDEVVGKLREAAE